VNIIQALLSAANFVIGLLEILIFVYVILSWIPQARDSKWGHILSVLIEPVLSPVRNLLNRIESLKMLPIDLSPIVAWFLLGILQSIISMILRFIIQL
jgi:YggT family protein